MYIIHIKIFMLVEYIVLVIIQHVGICMVLIKIKREK